MNVLDIEVSCFANYNTPDNPQPINLMNWLNSGKYAKRVEQIRATSDKAERDNLKATLPAITPSGLFNRREEKELVKHSGLIQIDIDEKENKHITNFLSLKEELKKLSEIAYIGLSVSGRGWWCLVPIQYPERHKDHFKALRTDFASWGIVCDEKPKNVASLRGYSYDPEAYFNPQAIPYTKLHQEQPEQYRGTYGRNLTGNEAEKVEACLSAIEANRIDITASYSEWFSIGCSFANEFGESGRDYFHRVSQYYQGYNSTDADKQYSYCLRRAYSYSIATFYQICKDYGIRYKEAFEATKEEPKPKPKVPEPPKEYLPQGWHRDEHGTLIAQDNLPAIWNFKPRNNLEKRLIEQEALKTIRATYPDAGTLIDTFGLEIVSIEPLEVEAEIH